MTFRKLSKKQKQVFRWCYRPGSYALICDGSVRSGKTAAMSCSFVQWAMRCFNGENFAFCGNTVQAVERNILMPLQQMVDVTYYYKLRYIGSKHILTVTGGGHSNDFYIFGGKDESSYKLVQGITLAGVLFDEVALMPESFVQQAIARTLSVDAAKLWFNCNPDSPEHWFYKEWVLKTDSGERTDTLHIHFEMQDNPVMTPEKIARTKSLFAGVFYDRYIRGQWVVAEGLVYPMFNRGLHIGIPNHLDGDYFVSVDYGTMNPTSMGLWCRTYDGHAYRISESYYNGRKSGRPRTDEEHYAALCALTDGYEVQSVIVDPSAASFIECIHRHGRFRVQKANNAVIPGIQDTAVLLDAGRLHFSEDCADCIREFGLYRYDPKKQDTVLKENDHAMDDMRYFVRAEMWRELQDLRR